MIDRETQVRMIKKVIETIQDAGAAVIEYGIHHLAQSKTNELRNGNELTITIKYIKQ